jgi:hypothetical protein
MKQIVRNPEVRQVASRHETYESNESLEVSVQQQIRTLQEEVWDTLKLFLTFAPYILTSYLDLYSTKCYGSSLSSLKSMSSHCRVLWFH